MTNIIIHDVTLRDGNHAVSHQLNANDIANYAKAIDLSGIDIVEVGHGNGTGASSFQVGFAAVSDEVMLLTARKNLKNAKLGIHIIPGFGRRKEDLSLAIDCGVDVIRVGSHCTEANTTRKHIEFALSKGKQVTGALMMSHIVDKETLLIEAKKMEDYGAEAVIIMDSAGAFLPTDVSDKIKYLKEGLTIPIGIHAHNNLGLAIANSVMALQSGATIIDASAKGFGAGPGNTPLEVLIAVLHKYGYDTGIDLYHLLDACDLAEKEFIKNIPHVSSLSIISGMCGVVAMFAKPIQEAAKIYGVDPRDIIKYLGEQKAIAGQEDQIIQIAQMLKNRRELKYT